MQHTHYLKLSKLLITGKLCYTTNDDIYHAMCNVHLNKSLMEQDIRVICQQISQLSWIKGISVRKQWPNVLKIYIIEYEPICYWNDVQMLDKDGVIFQVPIDRINDKYCLPILYGPEGSALDVLTGYRVLYDVIKSTGFTLRSVKMNHRYSWQIILKENIKLELGRKNKVERLQRFIKAYPFFIKNIQNDGRCINYIDLRYDYGFAVSWMTCSNYSDCENIE
ncbi:cell division protein FtsQ/DivIB [Blochmannia endosymbiont of Camponotus (Colobopsis) obliquus]|uniref:cell division protein FtsQ/DivIB n=1 Tax=Blochmannia endosymbiont of Camponotus (Colobopsis) obliquus TaxID=1505597 RepID=UPI001185CBF8|nr:cell division protein FtsQ/DivIB [Blochmannia endosymbiont of Camponotus (Colobopsis) obliquus]